MKRGLLIAIIVLLVIIIALWVFIPGKNETLGDLQCSRDSDCIYTKYVGGCYPSDYIQKRIESCADGSRPCLEEVLLREGVTCTCEENSCITHG